jgi:hypothetical protein
MRYLHIAAFTVILLLLVSCKGNPYFFQEDGIEFQIKKDKIHVNNKENSNLYYYIINRSSLPRILWAPASTDDNRIKPLQNKEFLIEEIPGYSEGMTKVSFFYWRSEDPEPGEAIQIVLELKK